MRKYILLIIGLFFLGLQNVNAYINAECIDEGTCMLLCNYINYRTHPVDNTFKDLDRNLSIYYYFDTNEFRIQWETGKKKINWKKGTMDYVFSTSGTPVYGKINETYSASNFVCPKYGFIDMDGAWDGNELCFDNDGTSCSTTYSNYATSFGIIADYSFFASHEKDYDFEDQLSNYRSRVFEDVVDDITSGTFDVKTDLNNKIKTDFNNFLHGHDIPQFIINSPTYVNFSNDLLSEYERVKEEELKKAEEEKNNQLNSAKDEKAMKIEALEQEFYIHGRITYEEYKEKLAQIEKEYEDKKDNADEDYKEVENNWGNTTEEIKSQVDLAFKYLNDKVNWTGDFKADNCESYLGNPKEKSSPAYYLQFIFNLIKYAAIVLLFALSAAEMAKAMTSNNQDALKKALNVTIKRLIIAVIIFFLPELIKFLLTILGMYSPSTCGIS